MPIQVKLTDGGLHTWNCQHSVIWHADHTTVFNVITAGDGAIGSRWYYVQLSVPPCPGLWVREQDCVVV